MPTGAQRPGIDPCTTSMKRKPVEKEHDGKQPKPMSKGDQEADENSANTTFVFKEDCVLRE